MSSNNSLKARFWRARFRFAEWRYWMVEALPGRTGSRLREMALRRSLQHLGEKNAFQRGFRVTSPRMVSIGSHCDFAQGVFITGGGGVTIGDWVGFGPDVKVWSVNHRFDDPDRPWLQQGWEYKPVVIEDDVWLAANVFVMPGVTIGRGAIVSAGAVVGKSVPPYAIVAGNPARVIGWRKKPGAEEATVPGEPAAATND